MKEWVSIFWVVLVSFLVVWVADLAAGQLAPIHHLREVEDAVTEIKTRNPRWLVIGSSHARTFSVVDRLLSRLQPGGDHLVAVPLEYGKMSSYEWVLRHRLRPLLEEKTRTGTLVRNKVQGVLLVTEWWDTVAVEGLRAHNLPARAWNINDFLKDVWSNGLTPYNQNYVRNRWMRLGSRSVLLSDRGHGRILKKLREKVRPLSRATQQRLYRQQIQQWQRMVEAGARKMLAKKQVASFHKVLSYFKDKGLSVVVVLYPRMPGTITQKAKKDTLETFAKRMKKICEKRKVKLVDLSYQSPLKDLHFSSDFDHLTAEGNRRFAQWSLEGPLRFLRQLDRPSQRKDKTVGK